MGEMSDRCERPAPKMPGISTWITRDNFDYADLKHGNARSPGAEQSTPLSCQFCATQCNLRCDAACQTRTKCGSEARTPGPVANRMEALSGSGKTPPPVEGERFEPPQLFGLAASIAARLTIWPISLACSASVRICACTYSLCSRITSVRSLACSSFSAKSSEACTFFSALEIALVLMSLAPARTVAPRSSIEPAVCCRP